MLAAGSITTDHISSFQQLVSLLLHHIFMAGEHPFFMDLVDPVTPLWYLDAKCTNLWIPQVSWLRLSEF